MTSGALITLANDEILARDRSAWNRQGKAVNTLSIRSPVIPVVVIDSVDDALPLAQALLDGGIDMLEITLRTKVALAAIEMIAHKLPQILVGAGTVRKAAEVQSARAAGCGFIVSPGYSPQISEACREQRLPFLPGVATATEIMRASEAGIDLLKFFPAEAAGGTAALASWIGPFPDIAFCPTGGINADTARQYLKLTNVRAVGGSWLTPVDALREKDWARITRLAADARVLR